MTRLELETLLIGADLVSGRRGRVCARVPLYAPGSAALGSVPALSGPIAGAVRFLGVEPASPANPSDADLAMTPAGTTPALIDIADLLLLEACLGNWDRWDQTLSLQSQKFGQLGDRLQKELDALRKECLRKYGYGLSSPSPGSSGAAFAAAGCWYGAPAP